jgi:hypothetical protein
VFNFTFLFVLSLICDKQEAQRRTVAIYGTINGEEDSLAHLLTRKADVAVARAARLTADCHGLLVIREPTAPLTVQPVRNALVIAGHLGGREKGTPPVSTDVFKFPKKKVFLLVWGFVFVCFLVSGSS